MPLKTVKFWFHVKTPFWLIFLHDLIFFVLFFRDALQSIVTALYCKILVILGLAFPMAEVISKNVPKGYYQLFYVYLFLGSLVFLTAVYIDLWRTKVSWALSNKKRKNEQNSSNRRISEASDAADFVDGISKLPRPRSNYGSFYLRLGTVCT